MQSVHASPNYAILFIADIDGGEPPYPERGVPIQSTPSCISFSCTPAADGGVLLTVGAGSELALSAQPVFDNLLDTPGGNVVVSTADGETLLSAAVATNRTRVRIWADGGAWPDRIWIGLD